MASLRQAHLSDVKTDAGQIEFQEMRQVIVIRVASLG